MNETHPNGRDGKQEKTDNITTAWTEINNLYKKIEAHKNEIKIMTNTIMKKKMEIDQYCDHCNTYWNIGYDDKCQMCKDCNLTIFPFID